MLGIDPVTVSSLLVLAAAGSGACAPPKPTAINVIPKTQKVQYDYTQSLADLQETQTDTINPYGFHGTSFNKGYASSPAKLSFRVEMGQKYMPQYQAYCFWYETIDIEISLEPQITIAKELTQDKCHHRAVLEHEMKHVKTTRRVVNKYTQSMGQKVYQGLKSRGFSSGLVPDGIAQESYDRMYSTVEQLVDLEWRKMQLEHEERQQAIDSLEEYERVNAQCPKFDYSSALKSK